MKYRRTKMHLKVSISALTCVIISTAAAVLLVCATNQTTNDERAKKIIGNPLPTAAPKISTSNKTTLSELARQASTSTTGRQLRQALKVENGTIRANGSGDIQAQASILRPLIFKHLLSNSKKRPASAPSSEPVEEEEEVTKTIMVPVNPDDAEYKPAGKLMPDTAEPSTEANDQMIQFISGQQVKLAGKGSSKLKGGAKHPSMAVDMQPNAEASLRLTSTEIGGLLNDREAPEFYRERELNGDGVLVGEERPSSGSHNSFSSTSSRLGTAASGHFGSQFMGGGGGGGAGFSESMPYGNNVGFDSSDAALYRHRLSQAASEEAYGGGAGAGFNHRFGQQAFGGGAGGAGDGSELGYGGAGGGLMQAPNEYSEVNSMGASGGFMGEPQGQSYGGGDYSLQSGLLRAGSEGMYGGGGGGGGGLTHGMGGSSGFIGASGPLETAAAGGYGAGGGEFGPAGDLMGHSNAFAGAGRLQAHASYNPYMQSAGEADYASRFGQHQGGAGFTQMGDYGDQRGFASQNTHQLLRAASSGAQAHTSSSPRGLLPLTPTVPLPEDLPSPVTQPSVMSSNQREQIHAHQPMDLSNLVRQQQSLQQQQRFSPRTRPSQQQIHEALEEDPTDTTGGDDEQSGNQQQAQHNYESIASTGDSDEPATSARPPGQQLARFSAELGPSLVLNVPPPGEQAGAAPVAQMVEFSRIGSAGYLGPRATSLAKKGGSRIAQHQPEMETDDESGGSSSAASSASSSEAAGAGDSEPIDNPAHAGKYIID